MFFDKIILPKFIDTKYSICNPRTNLKKLDKLILNQVQLIFLLIILNLVNRFFFFLFIN